MRVSYFESVHLYAHTTKRSGNNEFLRNNKNNEKYEAMRVAYEIVDSGGEHNNFQLMPTRWAKSMNG